MKLNEKVLKALNDQINKELYSAYLYRSLSLDLSLSGFKGYAHWLDIQYKEEIGHADKIIAYIASRGDVVELAAVDGVSKHLSCPVEAAKATLAHEEYISGSIRDLFKLAREEGDSETELFLQWFINEQIEEEKNANDVLAGFEAAKDCKGLLYMFDAQLGSRK